MILLLLILLFNSLVNNAANLIVSGESNGQDTSRDHAAVQVGTLLVYSSTRLLVYSSTRLLVYCRFSSNVH